METKKRLKSLTASRTLCGCGLKIIIMWTRPCICPWLKIQPAISLWYVRAVSEKPFPKHNESLLWHFAKDRFESYSADYGLVRIPPTSATVSRWFILISQRQGFHWKDWKMYWDLLQCCPLPVHKGLRFLLLWWFWRKALYLAQGTTLHKVLIQFKGREVVRSEKIHIKTQLTDKIMKTPFIPKLILLLSYFSLFCWICTTTGFSNHTRTSNRL